MSLRVSPGLIKTFPLSAWRRARVYSGSVWAAAINATCLLWPLSAIDLCTVGWRTDVTGWHKKKLGNTAPSWCYLGYKSKFDSV